MIAKLRGRVDSQGDDWAVIDVGGVGYLIFCSGKTLSSLPPEGEAVEVHVETHVREDHIHLYGFISAAEREWFRLLNSVQGVGSKVALAILGALTPETILQAIAAQDKTAITRAQGVGPKLAARIVNELKDKAGAMAIGAMPAVTSAKGAATVPTAPALDMSGEAVSALVNLGYGRTEAFTAVATAGRNLGEGASVEALIKGGLSVLAEA
ncbi:MAG: Holliday junction branch migration protein RuvA [Magnetospiraceae bacterium]